jgi:hypothetical protein
MHTSDNSVLFTLCPRDWCLHYTALHLRGCLAAFGGGKIEGYSNYAPPPTPPPINKSPLKQGSLQSPQRMQLYRFLRLHLVRMRRCCNTVQISGILQTLCHLSRTLDCSVGKVTRTTAVQPIGKSWFTKMRDWIIRTRHFESAFNFKSRILKMNHYTPSKRRKPITRPESSFSLRTESSNHTVIKTSRLANRFSIPDRCKTMSSCDILGLCHSVVEVVHLLTCWAVSKG